MKKITYYLLLFLLISSCSHRIIRSGYQINKSDYKNCDIIIQKFMTNTDTLQKVGEIKLGESGFSITCSEADAVEILRKEGCALGADLVNIVDESRPDFLSSCYRCRAVFYKLNGTTMNYQKNKYYYSSEINKRVSKDQTRNTLFIICGAVAGYLFGFYLFK